MKLKSGKLTFYDKSGNWIGPSEMKEHTYYETLKAINGIVETDHPVSIQWLINRGYQIIEEKQEANRESSQEPVSATIQEEKEEVKPILAQLREEWKKSPGRPRKY